MLCSNLQPRALGFLNHVVFMDSQSNYDIKYGHSEIFTTYYVTLHVRMAIMLIITCVHVTIIFRCKYSCSASIQLSNWLCLTVCAAFYVHTLCVAIQSWLRVHSWLLHWLLARKSIAGVSSLSFQQHALKAISHTTCANRAWRVRVTSTGAFSCGVLILVWVLINRMWWL